MGWGFQPGDPFEGTDLTSVLIGKDLILSGWWSKIEVIQVLGIYIYICHNFSWLVSTCQPHVPYRWTGPIALDPLFWSLPARCGVTSQDVERE